MLCIWPIILEEKYVQIIILAQKVNMSRPLYFYLKSCYTQTVVHALFLYMLLAQLVRSNRRHSIGGGFEPPPGRIYPACGKKTPRCAFVELGCATRLLGDRTRPMKVTEAGFRGFSRPGSTNIFLIESRGGGLSPTGRVFFFILIYCTID
jgi:hypothetical protein